MTNLKEITSRYDQELSKAAALLNHQAILKLVAEYRNTVSRLKDCSNFIDEELRSVTINGRHLDLILIAAYLRPNQRFVESLCKMLALGDPSFPNEQIVDILYKIPNPASIPYLADALKRKFAYDEYDEFGVKCLDALYAINTPEAWLVIESASASSSPRIKETALKLNSMR
jgi:hypothetical protein